MFFQTPPGPAPSQHLTLDVIDKLVKIAAVLIGALWTYLNYVRGRTFKKRLEPKISGNTYRRGSALLLSGSAELKNVGLSKIPVEQKGTAVLIYDLETAPSVEKEPTNAVEECTSVLSIFEDHGWIEPGETIQESFLLQLPEKQERLAIKLELRIVGTDLEWNANSIVEVENVKELAQQPNGDTENCTKQTTKHGEDGGHAATRSKHVQTDPDENAVNARRHQMNSRAKQAWEDESVTREIEEQKQIQKDNQRQYQKRENPEKTKAIEDAKKKRKSNS